MTTALNSVGSAGAAAAGVSVAAGSAGSAGAGGSVAEGSGAEPLGAVLVPVQPSALRELHKQLPAIELPGSLQCAMHIS